MRAYMDQMGAQAAAQRLPAAVHGRLWHFCSHIYDWIPELWWGVLSGETVGSALGEPEGRGQVGPGPEVMPGPRLDERGAYQGIY